MLTEEVLNCYAFKDVINIDQDVMQGAPVFKNTRVPVPTCSIILKKVHWKNFQKISFSLAPACRKSYSACSKIHSFNFITNGRKY
jgi:hypothetical protein